jgi:hypothetical protein
MLGSFRRRVIGQRRHYLRNIAQGGDPCLDEVSGQALGPLAIEEVVAPEILQGRSRVRLNSVGPTSQQVPVAWGVAVADTTATPRFPSPALPGLALGQHRIAALHGKQRLSRDTAWAMPQESLEDFIRCGYARFNQAERETVDEHEPAHAETAPL